MNNEKVKEYDNFGKCTKDLGFWERNQLICLLSKIFPSWLEKHDPSDEKWDKEWRTIIYIIFPGNKQASWHLHDEDVHYFPHCKLNDGNSWDGHNSVEKYKRIREIKVGTDK